SATQYLADGETATETFTVTVKDNHGAPVTQTVTVTVHGTNDDPVISVGTGDHDTASLDETNAGLAANGTLTVNDVDLSNTVTASVTGVVTSGDATGLGSDNDALKAMLSLTAGAINANAGDTHNLAWT